MINNVLRVESDKTKTYGHLKPNVTGLLVDMYGVKV